MPYEPKIALAAIRRLLEGDRSLMQRLPGGIQNRRPGQSTPYPYVLIIHQGGPDENTAGGRAYSQPTYLIKVVSEDGSQDEKADIALGIIDDLLQNYRGEQDGARVRIKSQDLLPEYTEPGDPGPSLRHAGRYYRVTVSVPRTV